MTFFFFENILCPEGSCVAYPEEGLNWNVPGSYASVRTCTHVHTHVRKHVRTHVNTNVRTHICEYARAYCLYARAYA